MRRLYLVVIGMMVALCAMSVQDVSAQTDRRCFNETGKCISGAVRQYWERNGGLAVFGFPITDEATETNAEGFTGPTQWFERDRLENQGTRGVLAGRLGAQKLALEGRPWEGLPKVSGAAAGCRFFPETGHSLCPPFRAYWENNGGLARFGFPISEPVTERNGDGYTGTFQWFERRRMEVHPENRPPFDILLGLLGKEVRSGGGGGDACAGIEAPQDMVREPANGCVRYGDVILFGAFGYPAFTEVGYFITADNGVTVGTAQTEVTEADGTIIIAIDTDSYFGYTIGPGNYRFVVQDAARRYRPSYANFRVLP